jgi:hypothetical protein
LPWLQARSAALCSGLTPWLERGSWTRRFVNVPREVADRIAQSLEQELIVAAREATSVAEASRQRPPHIKFSN